MIYQWSCDRRQFLDFMVNRKPLPSTVVRETGKLFNIGGEISLFWDRDPADLFLLPNVIVIDERGIIDFHAWFSTYFRQMRPITAQCRLLNNTFAKILIQSRQPKLPPIVNSALVGLIISEGIAYSSGRIDPNRLSFSGFARTLSFSLTKGVQLYQQEIPYGTVIDQIKNGWLSARQLSNQPILRLPPSEISDVFEITLGVLSEDWKIKVKDNISSLLIEALKELRLKGQIPINSLENISNVCQVSGMPFGQMDGPREVRVNAVESALRELMHGTKGTRKLRAFLAGYLASRIQPGSLEYFALLAPIVTELPESYLWYGACSGLSPETSVDNYGNGLGLLIKRELGRASHWLDRPHCDIALSEMTVLLKHREDTNINIRTMKSGILEVEIFPMVSTTVRWPESLESFTSERGVSADGQRSLFDDSLQVRQDVLEILSRLDESTKSINSIRKLVESKLGQGATRGGKWRK